MRFFKQEWNYMLTEEQKENLKILVQGAVDMGISAKVAAARWSLAMKTLEEPSADSNEGGGRA